MKKSITLGLLMVLCSGYLSVTGEECADNLLISITLEHSLEHSPIVGDVCWNDSQYYQYVAELGDGGYVKFANNRTHLFSLFVVDPNLDWVALEYSAIQDECMGETHDGLTIYMDGDQIDVYDETYDGASGMPSHDAINNLSYKFNTTGDYNTIEITRPLNSTDLTDLSFNDGDMANLLFASSDMHYGSHELYFLSVQIKAIEDMIIPDVPNIVDYSPWKKGLLIGGVSGAGAFIMAHILVRQIFKPLYHGSRIVDKNYKHPTLKSRWHNTFGKGSGSKQSLVDKSMEMKI